MKRSALILGIVLSLAASACAPQATPTANPLDIQHTAEAAAFTIVAQTEESIPTATLAPPTGTASPTLTPTETPLPSLTPDPLTISSTAPATLTPKASTSNQDPCNQPLVAWEGPSANITVANETKPQGTLVLSLYVVTDLGQCGYLYVTGDSLTGPVGQYSAGAFVTGKKNLKVFGGFRISEGSWKIVVRNESIIAQGGCYPNC